MVRGYFDRVEIGHHQQVIAVHERCWDRQQVIFEPKHYLPLLERKPGALDYARPLANWQLPDCFGQMRRRLEAELGYAGTREYIRVLRLLELHPISQVQQAVEHGLQNRVHNRDGIAQFIPPPEPWGQTTFTLDGRDHLRHVHVDTTDVHAYGHLLSVGGGQ